MGTQKITCRYYEKIENSPARRLYITAYKVLYGTRKINFKEFDEKTTYIVASIEGKPVGIIAFVKDEDERKTYINLVYTLTKYRKKGVMRKMFKHLLKKHEFLEWNAAYDAIPAYMTIGAKRKNGLLFYISKSDFINKK